MSDHTHPNSPTGMGVLLVTVGSAEAAADLAQRLVATHLAACVNIIPLQSVYTWQGQVHQEPECQLIIKTRLTRFEAIAALVNQHHSYDLPEIIALPIVQGTVAYLKWMADQTLEPN